MLHPSYTELIDAVNKNVPEGEEPIVTSRYSIIHAAAKRARQIVSGEEPLVEADEHRKALSVAVEELYTGEVKILRDEEEPVEESWETMIEESWMEDPEGEAMGPDAGLEDGEEDEDAWMDETDETDEAWPEDSDIIPEDAWHDEDSGELSD